MINYNALTSMLSQNLIQNHHINLTANQGRLLLCFSFTKKPSRDTHFIEEMSLDIHSLFPLINFLKFLFK